MPSFESQLAPSHPIRFKIDRRFIDWKPETPVRVFDAPAVSPLPDPAARLGEKLRHPDAGSTLEQYLYGKTRVLIVVSDHTRAVGYRHFLMALLNEINALGFPDAKIELLVAVGLHDPQPEDRTRESLGEDVCKRVKIHQHQCKARGELQAVSVEGNAPGAAARMVHLNHRLFEGPAQGVVLTGGITFHYHAGYGGGRKAVFPGCGSYEDVLSNHRLLMDRSGTRLRNPNCQPGRTDGNPIYDESIRVLRACPPMFLINSVLAAEGGIADFFTGEPIAAHRIGCEYLRQNFSTEIEKGADLVIAGAGGAPKDATLYQAHKALDVAERAVEWGGAKIFIAGLQDGLGPAQFRAALKYTSVREHSEALFGDAYSIPSQTCLACREKTAIRTWIVGPPEALHDDLRRVGFRVAPTVEAAVIEAWNSIGHSSLRTYVFPNAGMVMPVIAGKIPEV